MISNLTIRIITMLKDPKEEWTLNEHLLYNKRTGVNLWVCSGMFFVGIYESPVKFNLIEKFLLWRQ